MAKAKEQLSREIEIDVDSYEIEKKMQIIKDVISQEMISPITKSYDDLKELITGMEARSNTKIDIRFNELNTKIDEIAKSTVGGVTITTDKIVTSIDVKDNSADDDYDPETYMYDETPAETKMRVARNTAELLNRSFDRRRKLMEEVEETRAKYGWNQ